MSRWMPHEVGEILLRSPMVMTEYRNRPEETAAALAGGWLHTGDMGLVDEDGFLHVVDRQKDMFISGGINVYPAEIERVLAGLPGLEELAVVGVPDPKWGEVPLLVVTDLAAIDLDAVAARCVDQLADYKRPKLAVSHGGPLPRRHERQGAEARAGRAVPGARSHRRSRATEGVRHTAGLNQRGTSMPVTAAVRRATRRERRLPPRSR